MTGERRASGVGKAFDYMINDCFMICLENRLKED